MTTSFLISVRLCYAQTYQMCLFSSEGGALNVLSGEPSICLLARISVAHTLEAELGEGWAATTLEL